MKVYNTVKGIYIQHENDFYKSAATDWDTFINRDGLFQKISVELSGTSKISNDDFPLENEFLPPIKTQEIWAAGVTYLRSKHARVEESRDAGGGTFYDKVYDSERPEIFFKAIAQRTAGHLGKVRIRKDSSWDVPEPELTLFINTSGEIAGYTVGNDMSSRSIEGENPLFLPQAKMYDGCAGLGPCLYVSDKPINPDANVELLISRGSDEVFRENISINQMKRKHDELVSFLFRECSFPFGCFLMTGTGIIPPNSFTLQKGDTIAITIEHIGTLVNTVDK